MVEYCVPLGGSTSSRLARSRLLLRGRGGGGLHSLTRAEREGESNKKRRKRRKASAAVKCIRGGNAYGSLARIVVEKMGPNWRSFHLHLPRLLRNRPSIRS